mgnify:FL=1
MKTMLRGLLAVALLLAAGAAAKAEEILIQSAQSGLYVTVIGGRYAAAEPDAGRATRFERVSLAGIRVAFRDVRSDTYIRAGVGDEAYLAPGSQRILGWETFEPRSLGGGRVALRSTENGKFVRAGVGRRSHLAAVSDRVSGWETFRFVEVADSRPGQGGGHNAGPLPPRPERPDLGDLHGNYRITHVMADSGYLVQLGSQLARQSQLSVDDTGMVRATIGCNRMSVRISVRNGRVEVHGPAMSTRMMCSQQGQSAAERKIMEALETSRRVVRDGRSVSFIGANGAELLRLRRG